MYHVNPSTGMVGKCSAKSPESCPFGVENHYCNSLDAFRAGESIMERNAGGYAGSLSKPTTSRDHDDDALYDSSVDLEDMVRAAEPGESDDRELVRAWITYDPYWEGGSSEMDIHADEVMRGYRNPVHLVDADGEARVALVRRIERFAVNPGYEISRLGLSDARDELRRREREKKLEAERSKVREAYGLYEHGDGSVYKRRELIDDAYRVGDADTLERIMANREGFSTVERGHARIASMRLDGTLDMEHLSALSPVEQAEIVISVDKDKLEDMSHDAVSMLRDGRVADEVMRIRANDTGIRESIDDIHASYHSGRDSDLGTLTDARFMDYAHSKHPSVQGAVMDTLRLHLDEAEQRGNMDSVDYYRSMIQQARSIMGINDDPDGERRLDREYHKHMDQSHAEQYWDKHDMDKKHDARTIEDLTDFLENDNGHLSTNMQQRAAARIIEIQHKYKRAMVPQLTDEQRRMATYYIKRTGWRFPNRTRAKLIKYGLITEDDE